MRITDTRILHQLEAIRARRAKLEALMVATRGPNAAHYRPPATPHSASKIRKQLNPSDYRNTGTTQHQQQPKKKTVRLQPLGLVNNNGVFTIVLS